MTTFQVDTEAIHVDLVTILKAFLALASQVFDEVHLEVKIPKSEPNLESSFVFPQTGSKDIG